MTPDGPLAWAILVVLAGVIVWAVRQEGRITTDAADLRQFRRDVEQHYATDAAVKELAARVDATHDGLRDIRDAIKGLEGKLDRVLMANAKLDRRSEMS